MKKVSLVLLLLTGCVSQNMKAFIGHPSSDLIASWGRPSEKVPDGSGGEVWVYYQQGSYTIPGQIQTTATAESYTPSYGIGQATASGQSVTTYTPAQQHNYTNVRSFFISPEGIITGFRWRGL